MIHARVDTLIRAPQSQVMETYLDYSRWPEIFPLTIKNVHLANMDETEVTIEVQHVRGKVPNVLRVLSPVEVELKEWKRRYFGRFINRFESTREGTRYIVIAGIDVKWPYKVLEPLLCFYAATRIRRYVTEPMRRYVEGRLR